MTNSGLLQRSKSYPVAAGMTEQLIIQNGCFDRPESWCWAGIENKFRHNLNELWYIIKICWQL